MVLLFYFWWMIVVSGGFYSGLGELANADVPSWASLSVEREKESGPMSRASNIVNWPSPCFKLVAAGGSDRSDSLRLALQVSTMLWLPRSFAFYTLPLSLVRGPPQAVLLWNSTYTLTRTRVNKNRSYRIGETLDYTQTTLNRAKEQDTAAENIHPRKILQHLMCVRAQKKVPYKCNNLHLV